MNATVKTTGKFAPGLSFTKPSADAIHEAQRNARPHHGKTIRHLTAWADEVERRNERLVAELKELRAIVFAYQDGLARNILDMPRFKQSAAILRELGEDV